MDDKNKKSIDQRKIKIVNWLGLYTLYLKEVQRFTNVFLQTITAPMITTLLFILVFSVAIDRGAGIDDINYITFLVPGLLMMSVLQNAFANVSSAFMTAKITGSIVDLLLAPLGSMEIFFAHNMAGVTRGIFVFVASFLLLLVIGVAYFPIYFFWSFLFLILGGFALSSIGMIAGIWAQKFDQLSVVTNFIINPLAFLSGTFYSVERLPDFLKPMSYLNPFFYIIDGFRYGFLGQSDASPYTSLIILLVFNIVLGYCAWYVVDSGYRLKS